MALTPSTMLPLQHMAPDFNLLDVKLKENVSLTKLKGTKGTLVVLMCNHCPFVIHLLEHFNLLADELKPQGIATIAISSNDIENYPQDGPQQMVALCKEYGISFPYLYDPTQEVAKAYDAACTPDFYLFDGQNKLVYRGRYDTSRPQSGTPITGEDLKSAALNLINKNPYPKINFRVWVVI